MSLGRNWTMHLSDCAALTASCLMVVDPARLASYETDIDPSLYLSKRFFIYIPTDRSSLLTPLSSSNGFGWFISPPLCVLYIPLACYAFPTFNCEEHFHISRDCDLIFHDVIAGADLTPHLRMPIFDVPFQPTRRDMRGAEYG